MSSISAIAFSQNNEYLNTIRTSNILLLVIFIIDLFLGNKKKVDLPLINKIIFLFITIQLLRAIFFPKSLLVPLEFVGVNALHSAALFTLYVYLALMYFYLLSKYIDNYNKLRKLSLWFCITVFLHATSYIIGDFFHGSSEIIQWFSAKTIEGEAPRMSGLMGNYDLFVDYIIMVITFSFILYNLKYIKKRFFFVILIISMSCMVSTATRSSVIILIVFFLLLSFLFIKYKIISIPKYINIIILMFTLIFIIIYFFQEDIENIGLLKRFEITKNVLFEEKNIDKALNRGYAFQIPLIFKYVPAWGAGSLLSIETGFGHLIWHCVYLDVLWKYGKIIGLMFILLVFLLLIKLFNKIPLSKDIVTKKVKIILFSSFFVLLMQEAKNDFLRDGMGIFIYTVYLFVIWINVSENSKIFINSHKNV